MIREKQTETESKVDKEVIKAGEWVLVLISGKRFTKYFVGQVINKEGNEAKEKFMHFNCKIVKFYWPEIDDEC